MKKRAHERIPLDMKVGFLQSDRTYRGTIKNISRNGMYIETEEPLPFHSRLDLHIPFKSRLTVLLEFNNEVLEIPVKVKRIEHDGALFKGIGVMLTDASDNYMEFMKSLTAPN